MLLMCLFVLLIDFSSSSSLLATRNMKMNVYRNSFYQLGYFGNFIQNVSARTLLRCVIECQNHDQCRLANYNSQTLICSLIDESSFVGQIITSSSETSVIALQLCEDPAKQEPQYLCFGTVRPAVTLQYAIDNSQAVANINRPVFIGRFSSTGLLYSQEHISDTLHVYELNSYTRIQTLKMFSGQQKRNFDADFANNYFVFTGYNLGARELYIISPSGNRTISATNDYVGVCLSDRYIIVTRKIPSSLIDVYERSDGTLAFQITGINTPNGCGVIRDQLLIATDDAGIKSTNILNRTNTAFSSWPYGAYRPGLTNIAIDSSDRTYTPCASCIATYPCIGTSVCSIVSSGLDSTQLATLGNYWYTAGRATKYKYRFLGTELSISTVALFEY